MIVFNEIKFFFWKVILARISCSLFFYCFVVSVIFVKDLIACEFMHSVKWNYSVREEIPLTFDDEGKFIKTHPGKKNGLMSAVN